MLEKMFKLRENHTTVKTEILAGITTFMTMAYILAVNPNVLSAAGMDQRSCIYRDCTCFISGNGMHGIVCQLSVCSWRQVWDLNAYFAYTVVIGMGYPWQAALAAVFVEGADLHSAFAV